MRLSDRDRLKRSLGTSKIAGSLDSQSGSSSSKAGNTLRWTFRVVIAVQQTGLVPPVNAYFAKLTLTPSRKSYQQGSRSDFGLRCNGSARRRNKCRSRGRMPIIIGAMMRLRGHLFQRLTKNSRGPHCVIEPVGQCWTGLGRRLADE